MPKPVSPRSVAASLTEYWSPRVIAELDDSYVKVAKVKGEAVELAEGDTYVVPKGVRHNPVADDECHVMLIERKTALHTGSVVTDGTRSLAEQLRTC